MSLRKQSAEIINEVVTNATPEELDYILRKCSVSLTYATKPLAKLVTRLSNMTRSGRITPEGQSGFYRALGSSKKLKKWANKRGGSSAFKEFGKLKKAQLKTGILKAEDYVHLAAPDKVKQKIYKADPRRIELAYQTGRRSPAGIKQAKQALLQSIKREYNYNYEPGILKSYAANF